MDRSQSSSFNQNRTRRGVRTTRAFRAVALLGLIVPASLPASDSPAQKPSTSTPLPSEGLSGAAFLEKAWPGHPEWLAMLADIMIKGERMSGRDGWFRKGAVQTRFDWNGTRLVLDKDGNNVISPIEFSGPDADFARLDRNRDRALTAADFDFANAAAGACRPLCYSAMPTETATAR